MHKLLYFLLIFGFLVLVNCKGGGGHAHSGGHSRSSGGHSGSDAASLLIILIVLLVWCCCLLISCFLRKEGVPKQTNEIFVASTSKDVEQGGEEVCFNKAFQSGNWSCRYFQNDTWHGPHILSLSFDNADMTVKGSGTDDVGTFTIDGIYSGSTHRIGVMQHYQPGTGDPTQNLGHSVIIQLIYNAQSNKFEGTWYARTHKYHGEDLIELTFVEPQVEVQQ